MRNVFFALSVLILSACVSSTAAGGRDIQNKSEPDADQGQAGQPGIRNKDFLPHIDIRTWGLSYYADSDFYDRYTRILILPSITDARCPSEDPNKCGKDSAGSVTGIRDYENESRNWFERWLLGKTVSQAFVATFDLNNGETKFSKELFSLSFDSNNTSGESWATSQGLSAIVSPYFKVGAGDTLSMTATLNLSENNKSDVSANIVTALSNAAQAISPQSSLVTKLSSDRINKASSFLDDNVSALFDKSISESLHTDIQLELFCDANGFVAQISLNVPEVANIKQTNGSAGVGDWYVYLESPIESIFTKAFVAKHNCESSIIKSLSGPDYSKLQTGDVLEFKIADELTIYDYVFSRLEITDVVKVLNDNSSNNADAQAVQMTLASARSICARIQRRLPDLGLNRFDTSAVLWAVANSDQFGASSAAALMDTDTCLAAKRWNDIPADRRPH